MDNIKENISLQELTELENLSVRSFNVCKWNELNDLLIILNYFRNNNNFFGLKNCGKKSNTELIELCHKYENFVSKPIIVKLNNPIENLIDNLNARQRKILNNLIESQAINLSIRSLNAIEKISDSSLTIDSLKEILINPRYDLGKIINIGEKSVKELEQFFKEVREKIEIVNLFQNDDELTIELFNTSLRRIFRIKQEDIVKIWNNYDSINGLPVFKTINTLISNGYIFNENEQEIFNRGFNFWTNSIPEQLENIASDIKLTRERTRQIRKKLLDEIELRFNFFQDFEFNTLNLYSLNIDNDIILVDENLIEQIQQKESVKYNDVFVIKILAIIFNKTHEIVGNIESLAFNIVKYKGVDSKWNSNYLIKKELKKSYDFDSLINDIKRRLSEKIHDDYSFHFETYLTNFIYDGVELDYSVISPIAEHIIFNEFTITIDLDDNINFKKNTLKQVFEYSNEALEALGEPSKVDVIYQKIKELYPDYDIDENSIRSSMKRKNGFVPFGRTSVFGLKEWEEEKDIRGGTIRDITEEYLLIQEEPKHIDEITEYVNKYRSTSSKNIYANLHMETNSRFTFFNGSFIGLKAKHYNNLIYTKIKRKNIKVRSWEDSLKLLSEFAFQNSRLPFSTGNEEEQKLYRFMNIQLRKTSQNRVEQWKINKIKDLIKKYNYEKKARRNPKYLNSPYIELTEFILAYKRLPNSRNEEEKPLYHFFYKQTKKYNNGDLLPEHQIKYLEIKSLINEIYGN